jgi:ribosome-binding protein aMBF1 (putative translation factor)
MLRLTLERQKKNWTKARLAREAELDQSLVSKVESGRVCPYPGELRRMARALRLPLQEAERLLEQV